jgi:hypothetical protein
MTPQLEKPLERPVTSLAPAAHLISQLELFLDSSGFAATLAKIIEFRTSHSAAAFERDTGDGQTMRLKYALYAFAVGNLAYGECRVKSSVTLGNYYTFVGLEPLTFTFLDPNLNDDRITGRKIRDIRLELLLLNLVDYFGH